MRNSWDVCASNISVIMSAAAVWKSKAALAKFVLKGKTDASYQPFTRIRAVTKQSSPSTQSETV